MDIKTVEELDQAILELEKKKVIQKSILKAQFNDTIDHFKPKNLIKSAFKKAFDGDTTSNVLKTVGGIGAGLVAKGVLFSNPTSMAGKIAVNAIRAGAAKTLFSNKDKIAAWGTAIANNLFKKKENI